jgi:hypothetical protein
MSNIVRMAKENLVIESTQWASDLSPEEVVQDFAQYPGKQLVKLPEEESFPLF